MDIEVDGVHAVVSPILGEEFEITLDDGTIIGYVDSSADAKSVLASWLDSQD
jgi:hypothetical protein